MAEIYQYRFSIKDHDLAEQIDQDLWKIKDEENSNFYFSHIQTPSKHLFKITTEDPEEEHLKKFIFRYSLKLENGIKSR